jgi:hypothetical protein
VARLAKPKPKPNRVARRGLNLADADAVAVKRAAALGISVSAYVRLLILTDARTDEQRALAFIEGHRAPE